MRYRSARDNGRRRSLEFRWEQVYPLLFYLALHGVEHRSKTVLICIAVINAREPVRHLRVGPVEHLLVRR